MTNLCTTQFCIWHAESSLQRQCKKPLQTEWNPAYIIQLIELAAIRQHDEKANEHASVTACEWVCVFPLLFLWYISTSLLSIHHVLSADSLFHSPQTLALFQMRIDPTVNLISMILCRAFSFTALHSAKQTWLFQSTLYRSDNATLSKRKLQCKTLSSKTKRHAEECAGAVLKPDPECDLS